MEDETFLKDMCDNIVANKKAGVYDGAYKAVKLAFAKREAE